MAGVWDALGEGVSRGVAAYLAGREMQAKRKTEEEEKAREMERWIFQKMVGEKGLEHQTWEQQQAEKQVQEAVARAEQERQDKIAAATAAFERSKELARLEAELQAKYGQAGQKKPEPEELYNPGFDRRVALDLASRAKGISPDAFLAAIMGSQGQALANYSVSALVPTYGDKWPNLETDLWNYFTELNNNIKRPAAPLVSTPPIKGPGLLQRLLPGQSQEAFIASLGAGTQGTPTGTYAGPKMPDVLSGAANVISQASSPLPEALKPRQEVTQSVTSPQGGPSPQEQQFINEYNSADFITKNIYKSYPMYQEVSRKYPNLIR